MADFRKLTIRQIGQSLNAKKIYGEPEHLDYVVNDIKVAAMGLENILKYISEGTLVITPSDRIDILAGLAMTLISGTYPKISGILLTGNFEPSEQVIKLFEGMKSLPLTIFKGGRRYLFCSHENQPNTAGFAS